MPHQHELAARARSSSQQELAARADTSSQHEPARAQPARARSTSQLEPRHKRARARNQARPTLRSPCAALRPSPSPQDGRWRPRRIERKFSPVPRVTAERAATILYAQRHDGAFNKATFCSTRKSFNLLTRLLHDPSLSLQSTFQSWFFEPDRGRTSPWP